MKKNTKRNSEIQSIGELLSSSKFKDVIDCSKIDIVAKHATIFSFWNDILGLKFINLTKPFAIKNKKLYISAKSPVIIQELNLYKTKLLKKINSYSMPLGIEIKDIVYSYKNYTTNEEKENDYIEDKPENIPENLLNSIKLNKKTTDNLKKHINKINFLSENQKEILLNKIIAVKKAKVIQDAN